MASETQIAAKRLDARDGERHLATVRTAHGNAVQLARAALAAPFPPEKARKIRELG